jgi:hypothetical protein
LEFSISAPLTVEPDGVFLLEGAVAHFTLREKGVDTEGVEVLVEVDITKEKPEYKLEIQV